MDTVSAALGDARQLFHVEVQQITGSGVLVAQLAPAHAMQLVEAVEAEAPEHGVDGGTGEPERPGDAVRPEPRAAAHGADAPLQLGCGAPGVTVRRRVAALEAGHSRLAVAAHPLRDRRARDPEAPGNLRLRPAGHLQNHLQPGDRRQTRVTMCHERLPPATGASNTHSSRRGPSPATTFVGTTVSGVHGWLAPATYAERWEAQLHAGLSSAVVAREGGPVSRPEAAPKGARRYSAVGASEAKTTKTSREWVRAVSGQKVLGLLGSWA